MSREIKDKVCDGLEYLYSRADFWRQQKPMYARKRDRKKQEEQWKKGKRPAPSGSMDRVLRNLEDIDDGTSFKRFVMSAGSTIVDILFRGLSVCLYIRVCIVSYLLCTFLESSTFS